MARTYNTVEKEERPVKLGASRARQASWGRHIFWVLIISTTLAAITLLGSLALHSPSLQGIGGQTRSDAVTTFEQPLTAPRQQ